MHEVAYSKPVSSLIIMIFGLSAMCPGRIGQDYGGQVEGERSGTLHPGRHGIYFMGCRPGTDERRELVDGRHRTWFNFLVPLESL
jgi:hypothetical protein